VHDRAAARSAHVLGQADPCSLDLPLAGLAAKLADDFGDLGRAGRPDRVTLGLEAARGVDRDLTADCGETGGRRLSA
jgi:hypothetical protein